VRMLSRHSHAVPRAGAERGWDTRLICTASWKKMGKRDPYSGAVSGALLQALANAPTTPGGGGGGGRGDSVDS